MNRRIEKNRLKAPAPAPVPAPPSARRSRWNARAWREQHATSCRESLGRLAKRPVASALTLTVLSLALTLPLLFWLLLDNVRSLSGSVEDARAVSAFLKPDLDATAIDAEAKRVRERPDVAAVEVKTPEQGLTEFRSRSGFADALAVLHYNPLPAVLVIALKASAGEAAPALVEELRRDPAVDLVQYDAQWRQRLNAIVATVARGAGVVALLLALAALLVIGNTVRLDIQGRRDEIGVMQLLGASDGFVRRPFLYTGFWYGLLAGVMALILIGLVEWALSAPLARLVASYDRQFDVHGVSPLVMLAALGASAALGWLGAWLAASRHIASGQPQ